MSGTYDFIDEAVEQMKAGGHSFVLLALTSNGDGTSRYSIRSGVRDEKDMATLIAAAEQLIPPHLEELRRG